MQSGCNITLTWFWFVIYNIEKENKLLLIAVGGFVGLMICSISTILLALKERIQNRRGYVSLIFQLLSGKCFNINILTFLINDRCFIYHNRFKKDRSTRMPTESIHYSIAENSNIRFIEKVCKMVLLGLSVVF